MLCKMERKKAMEPYTGPGRQKREEGEEKDERMKRREVKGREGRRGREDEMHMHMQSSQ